MLVDGAEEGFTFKSHLDGSTHLLTPEQAVQIQALIGADVQIQLDLDNMIASITGPRLMLVGGGASAEIAAVLQRLGCARPLVVSDKFMQASGPLERLTGTLKAG